MKRLHISILILFTIAISCKQKFIPNIQSPSTGYLVVEGFINSGADPTVIHLSRTVKVYDTADIIYEENAQVTIEGQNNESYTLSDNGNGTYISSGLTLNNSESYRLHIFTADGKEYASDFADVKHTPVIDSLTYLRNNNGVTIYVNTHDASNTIKYYKWDYEETWEFHSAYESILQYYINPLTSMAQNVEYRDSLNHNVDSSIYKCWQSNISKNINIGSSEKLVQPVIHLPLLFIENASPKISVLYSINVTQVALSNAAYLFYGKIKMNTENLGSLFDPQPYELQGNIHCVTIPSETVIGFIEVSEEKKLRFFINNKDLPDWDYNPGCQLSLIDNKPDSIAKYAIGTIPTLPVTIRGYDIIDFYASSSTCVDCTLSGTNIKPSFWP